MHYLNDIQNITQSFVDIIDVRSQLEQQIQNQETKNLGWKLTKIFQ